MNYESKKSDKFVSWLTYDLSDLKYKTQFLVELEKAARLLVHDFAQQGEATLSNIQALAKAVKALEEAYAS